jgi:hypothetical protein
MAGKSGSGTGEDGTQAHERVLKVYEMLEKHNKDKDKGTTCTQLFQNQGQNQNQSKSLSRKYIQFQFPIYLCIYLSNCINPMENPNWNFLCRSRWRRRRSERWWSEYEWAWEQQQ